MSQAISWGQLKPEQALELRARARAEVARRDALMARWGDLQDVIPDVTPSYQRPTHLLPLTRALDRSLTEPVNILLGAPPRHAKSVTVFHHVGRVLKLFPHKRVAYATYSGDFARRQSRIARGIAARMGVTVGGEVLDPRTGRASASASVWQTGQGGGFLAVGRGGAITGEGVDLLIVDDPFKDRAEAESPAIREKVWDHWQGTLFNRLEPGASVLVMHQGWNDDDLIRRIIENARLDPDDLTEWTEIMLRALDDQDRPLWPERYDARALKRIRVNVGPYNWASQYLNDPKPKGSRLFGAPSRFSWDDWNPVGKRPFLVVDPATTAATRADHTVIGLVYADLQPFDDLTGERPPMRLWVHTVWRFQRETPEVVSFLRDLQQWLGSVPCAIEAVGGFKATPQTLRRLEPDLMLDELHPVADKFTRWQPAAAAWNDGRIMVPHREAPPDAMPSREIRVARPWVRDFLRELGRVTGVADAEDDQADMVGHAWDYAEASYGLGGGTKPPERQRAPRAARQLGGF